ncbi:protein SPMIP1-like [Clavelina lepadiformis]|uniref:Sperm microtubule inner protein 1 C-terminal domain-containing protein n=1 Tax=Clavelina lepadiformis TaxID=159417 RepID=A0ABP0GCR2_CLALP
MARELNMDTQRQNFWKEAIKKEAFVRLAWHGKYANEIKEQESPTSKEKRLARAKKFTEMVPKPPTRSLTLPVINYPKKRPTNVDMVIKPHQAGDNDPDALLVEMRPVAPGVKRLLYHGFTKEGKGRHQYLQARTFKKPEEKYDYPLTTSWEYGWRLDDVVKEFRTPQFGRSRIVRDTFFRRNGILYAPITA